MKMSGREITALAARIAAIFVLIRLAISGVQAAVALGNVGNVMSSPIFFVWFAGVAVALCSLGGIAIMLWSFSSRTLAAPEESESSGDARELEPIILSALGIYLAVAGLAGLFQTGLSEMAYGSYMHGGMSGMIWMPSPVGDILRLIIGAWLVFGSNGWVALLRRLREAKY